MVKFLNRLSEELSLYVRQSAWLNARPKKAARDKSEQPEPTRRERLKEEGIDQPDMPPCTELHLVGYLFEIGPAVPAGMGEGPLTHGDIAAWMGNVGIPLTPWQARTLRRLSIDYLAESNQATELGHPAPWQSQDTAIDKVVAVNVSKNAIRNLAKL